MKKFLFFALIIFFSIPNWEAYGENPGSIKWSILLGNPETPFLSSPAIGPDGTIYAGYYDSIGAYSGKLYAIKPNGTVKWNLPISVARGTHPTVDSKGNIYVGSLDEFIYSIKPDGSVNWTYQSYDGGPTSPGIGKDGTIYLGGDKLLALNQDGILKWFDSLFGGWGPDFNTPTAVSPDGTIYIGVDGWRYSHWLFAYNPGDSRDIKWRFEMDDDGSASRVSGSPAIATDGTIYVCGRNIIIAINPDGSEKWRVEDVGSGSPSIAADRTIYVSSEYPNELFAISPEGAIKWKYPNALGTPAIGSDGTIYVRGMTYDSYEWKYFLLAINPDGSKKWASDYIGYFTELTLSDDGIVYIISRDGYLYAFYSSSDGIQKSQWPMYRHDAQHTGMATWNKNPHPHKLNSVFNTLLLLDK
jgi:outer membrane protein assembly factor BamB